MYWHVSNGVIKHKAASGQHQSTIKYVEISNSYAKILTNGSGVVIQHCGLQSTCRVLRGYSYLKGKLKYKPSKKKYVVLYHLKKGHVGLKIQTDNAEYAYKAYNNLGSKYAKIIMKNGKLSDKYYTNPDAFYENIGYYWDNAGGLF